MRAVLFIMMCGFGVESEIIDRIAVSVGNQVITSDQITDEIRVTALLNHKNIDLSGDERKKAAERLIEQALIRREMDLSHYPVPPISEADSMLKNLESQYPSRAAFLQALAHYGITEEDVKQHLWWQVSLLRFVAERFRPSVQITAAELRDFYNEQAANWKKQGKAPIPSFEESRATLENLLVGQRTDQALDRWIGDARTQIDIRFRPGAFE